jgi:hypothetical protein
LAALPFVLLLSFGSGVATLSYEVVWFQLLRNRRAGIRTPLQRCSRHE